MSTSSVFYFLSRLNYKILTFDRCTEAYSLVVSWERLVILPGDEERWKAFVEECFIGLRADIVGPVHNV